MLYVFRFLAFPYPLKADNGKAFREEESGQGKRP